MYLRDRLIALIYRIACSILGLFLVIMVFVYSPSGSEPFLTFSIESSILLVIGFFLLAICNAIDLYRKGRVGIPAGIKMTVSLAFLSYGILGSALFFAGESIYDVYFLPWHIALNVIVPVLYLLDFLVFQEKGTVGWTHPLFWALYPVFYGVTMMVRPYITGFMNVQTRFFSPRYFSLLEGWFAGNDGWNGVAISYVVFLLSFLAIAYLVVLLSVLLGQRFRKKDKDAY